VHVLNASLLACLTWLLDLVWRYQRVLDFVNKVRCSLLFPLSTWMVVEIGAQWWHLRAIFSAHCASSVLSIVTPNLSSFSTSSMAHSATRRYLHYSEADFEVFRPAGATHCIDGEIWRGGGDQRVRTLRSPPPCRISPPSVQRQGYMTPKTEICTEIWSTCGL